MIYFKNFTLENFKTFPTRGALKNQKLCEEKNC